MTSTDPFSDPAAPSPLDPSPSAAVDASGEPSPRERPVEAPLPQASPARQAGSPSAPAPSGSPGSPSLNAPAGGAEESPWEFWRSVLITLAIALGIRQFLVEARYIPSGSMLPGLQLQDRLLVEKLTYRSRLPRRGEVVVFHAPHHFDPVLRSRYATGGPLQCLLVNIPLIGSLPGLEQPACDAFIKRVVGLPGERVAVDPLGRVSIDGRLLNEPYVSQACPVDAQGQGPCRTLNTVVPPNHILVLGDNRANSWDSRFWPGGPFLPRQEVIGRAFFRFYPFSSFGPLSGASSPAR